MTRDRSKLRRRLFMEPLEDRRMLAIAGDLTGGLLKFTGDASANDFSVVNVAASTYVFSSATDNITITDNDGGVLTIVGNGTAAVTVTAPAGTVNNMSIDLAGGGDTTTLAGLTAAASSGLKSLTVNDTGAAGTDTVKLAGNVDIDGNFTLSGVENLLLTASATIDTEQGNNSNSGNVNLGGAVTSANAAGLDLTIDATTGGSFTAGVAILGALSNAPGPQFVHNLTISGPSTTVITADMHTSGDLVFNGDVQLAADATLTASNVVFSGKLDDDGSAATTSNLTINTTGSGSTQFGSAVGGISALTSITTNADGSTLIDGSVHTAADQIYNDPVTLGGDATLTANKVTFASTLNDDGNIGTTSGLTINASGATTFGGAVGGATPTTALSSLEVDGTVAINGGSVRTIGQQTYRSAIALGADTSLAGQDLLLFVAANVTANNHNLVFNLPVAIGGSITIDAGSGNVNFTKTVDGSGADLTVNSTGTITFGDKVGQPPPTLSTLKSLTTSAGSTTTINGSLISTTDTMTFGGAVVIGGPTVMLATLDGVMTIAGTLTDAVTTNLTLESGDVTLTTATLDGANPADPADDSSLTILVDAFSTAFTDSGVRNVTTGAMKAGSLDIRGGDFLNDVAVFNGDLQATGTGKDAAFRNFASAQFNGNLTADRNVVMTINTGSVAANQNIAAGNDVAIFSTASINVAGTIISKTVNLRAATSITLGGAVTAAQTIDLVSPTVTANTGANITSTASSVTVGEFASTGTLHLAKDVQISANTDISILYPLVLDGPGGTNQLLAGGDVATEAISLGTSNLTVQSSGGGSLDFNGTINGSGNLIANTAGQTTFAGAVGAVTPLTSLTTDAVGLTQIVGGAVTTTGGQTYNDAVTLGANAPLTSTGAGNISFAKTVNGAFTLTINTAGVTTFGGAVGGTTKLTSVATDAAGSTAINGGSMTTTGDQSFNDAVTLGADTTLDAGQNANVTLANTVNGAQRLNISTSSVIVATLGGLVGGVTPLTSLTTTNGVVLGINGGGVITTGAQTYGFLVTISNTDATLTSTGNSDITFNFRVDGPRGLSINTGGITTFADVAGAGVILASLTTDAGGATHINGGSVRTTGAQTYNDAVTLGAATGLTSTGSGNVVFATTLNGAFTLAINTAGLTTFGGAVGGISPLASIITDSPGSTAINGGSVTTSGGQTYNDAVTLGADTLLTSTGGGNITFASTVNGPFRLTVNTAGTTTFSDTVGGSTALNSVTTDLPGSTAINGGSVTTTGSQTYNDAVTLGANTLLTSTGAGNITLANIVNGPFTLTVNTAGTTTFGGAVGGTTALLSVTTDGPGSTALNGGSVTTTGSQTYNDAVTLGANALLTSTGGGNIKFANTVNGAFSLTVNTAGTTTFGGAVGGTTPLATVTTDAPGTTAINGGLVTTTGGQTYNDAVTLGGNIFLASTGGGDITLASTVNGGSLTVNTIGTTLFDGVVGGITPLGGLTTNAGGATRLNGGAVTTGVGGQTHGDAITLGANTVLTSTGIIRFQSTVDGTFTLGVNTSDVTRFDGPVGSLTPLASLATDAGGTTAINGGSVTTTGSQTYNDAVTLGADAVLTSTGGANIKFASTVNGASTLTVNTTGTTTFGGTVGNTTPLTSVTTNAGGSTAINGGAITTTGSQTYNDAVTLGADAVLTSTGAGNITFANTIDGAFALTVNTTGTTTFGGIVGGTTSLAALTTNAGGTTHINTTAISASVQTYNDDVILGSNTRLGSSVSTTFNGAVDGPFDLDVFSIGTATFNKPVGGTTPLANIIFEANINRINADVTGTGNVSLLNQVFVQNPTTHLVTIKGNFVQFLNFSSLNGAVAGESLTVVAAAGVPFNGVVGNTQPLKNLTVTANDGTISAAGNITTTGAIQFTATDTLIQPNNITIATGVAVRSTGGSIEFDAGDDIHLIGTATLIAGTTVTLKVDVGNADLGIGQNLTIDATATIVTAAGAFLVGGSDNDTISFYSLPGTTFDVKAGAGNDTISVINKNPDGTARLVTIDGQTDNPTEMATIRQGGVNATKRPYFLPTAVAVSVADKVFWDDTAATHLVGLPTGNIYHLTGGAMVRNGNVELNYANIELLNLKTGQGNDDVTADMNAGPLPNIVQINDAGGIDNRFQVEGSAANDNISIGDIGTTLVTSGGPLRASFELAGFQRQWVRGNGGNDVIDNISKVPGVLDGGINDDTINSIVNVANSKLVIKQNVAASTINNVTLVLGNLGHDHLYVGSGAIDGPLVAGSIAAALKAFPDKSITFLIGDYKANATGNKLVQVVAGGESGDTYSSSSSAFQHGFVALKDTTPSRGIFKFGAGDTIRFSSTIAWLKAQIFVKAALNGLVNGPLSRQLAAYTKVVGPTAEGEAVDFNTLDDSADISADDSAMLLAATTDVNRDGLITPIDALLVINDLNARGSRQLPPPITGEGEDTLDDESTDPQPMFDVNGDGFLSPADALSVINTLNMLAADNTSPDGEVTSDDTAAAVDTLMQVPTTTTPPATSSTTTISDALMSLMALGSQTATRKKSP